MRSLDLAAAAGLLLAVAIYGASNAQEAAFPLDVSTPVAGSQQPGSPMVPIDLSPVFDDGAGFVQYELMIDGEAMLPALDQGDYILIDASAYRSSLPRRGDIIVFDAPTGSDKPYIKRIIGLPGEEVTFGDGNVFINGELLPEDYIKGRTRCGARPDNCDVIVPEGYVYVLGDYRINSSDSRVFGPVPITAIFGRAGYAHRDPMAHPLTEPGYPSPRS